MSLICWVASFLDHRTLQLKFDGEEETVKGIETGIPQGSPISPILFLIYIREIFKTRSVHVLSYMDYLAITTTSTSMKRNIRILERQVSQLFEMASLNSIQFDPSKTELMHSTNRKASKNHPLTLPDGKQVAPKDSIRWLGILFDPGLKFRGHVATKTAQATQKFYRMS